MKGSINKKQCCLVLGDVPGCKQPAQPSALLLDTEWDRRLPGPPLLAALFQISWFGLRFQHLLSEDSAVPSPLLVAVNQER